MALTVNAEMKKVEVIRRTARQNGCTTPNRNRLLKTIIIEGLGDFQVGRRLYSA